MTDTTRRARRHTVVALACVWLVAPLALMAARWPAWWIWIAPEQTPMTWLQSVALVLAAAAAVVIVQVRRLAVDDDTTRGATTGRAAGTMPWWMLAVGLTALAIDERFALHERLRDGVLAPRGVTVPFLPWVGPGDFLLLLVGLVGLAVLPIVWRAVADNVGARRALAVGVGLAIVAVAMDSIDPSAWTTAQERIEQTAEEIVELGSGLALLAAVSLSLLSALERLSRTVPRMSHQFDERARARRPDAEERSDGAGDRAPL